MCWIAGIFGECVEEDMVLRSLEKVRSRGSSKFELQVFPHAVLGANRLPIQGRDTGMQPVSNEDDTIRACQNGEIFNYLSLKQELETLGHIFKTDCDTEVLVHLYESYGVEAIKKIDSEMFAFIVYDSKTWAVFVGRDALGVKPLYYGFHENGNIHFASEAKQLVQFEDIKHVFTFPKWHYYFSGEFCRYADLLSSVSNPPGSSGNQGIDEEAEKVYVSRLTHALQEAVKKRVQTDLPIGVFLSGGVDSSLVMELATRYHPDVTAIILGVPWASDYEFAVRLCKERGYNYHVVSPDQEYRKNVEEMIYYTETYEPLIIRHAFANDMCSRAAAKLGIKIVLLGEWSDEIFAWYNEFSYVPPELINTACLCLLNDLEFGHLKRVDRLAMKYTIETRCPFLDTKVVEMWATIPSIYKLKEEKHETLTKYILRKVAAQFLPDYIARRYKVPFANGAGMDVGYNYKKSDGEVSAYIDGLGDFAQLVDEWTRKKYTLQTNTEAHHFLCFEKFGYAKRVDDSQRLFVKDIMKEMAYVSASARRGVVDFVPAHVQHSVQSINNPKYSKCRPDHEARLYELVKKSFEHGTPLSFFLFWWASDKEHVDEFDLKCIAYLEDFFSDIAAVYAFGVHVTFLLADEHGLNNGYSKDTFYTYFGELEYLFAQKWWSVLYISELYCRYDFVRQEKIQQYLDEQPEGRWEQLSIRKTLEKSSEKYYVWNDPVQGAQSYLAMRMSEKPLLEDCFRDAVFVTFGSKDLQALYPKVPILYMYTGEKCGVQLPWFN